MKCGHEQISLNCGKSLRVLITVYIKSVAHKYTGKPKTTTAFPKVGNIPDLLILPENIIGISLKPFIGLICNESKT